MLAGIAIRIKKKQNRKLARVLSWGCKELVENTGELELLTCDYPLRQLHVSCNFALNYGGKKRFCCPGWDLSQPPFDREDIPIWIAMIPRMRSLKSLAKYIGNFLVCEGD